MVRVCSRAVLSFFVLALLFVSSCHRSLESKADFPRLAVGVRMQDVRFHSVALGREMPYRVFLPDNLPAGRKLPVVYLLHGGGGDFRDWSNDSNVADYARNSTILVMPQGDMSYYMNEVGSPRDKYQDYITKDLIADVERRFPAIQDRASRAIVGISMGGFASVEYALVRPDLFVFAGALSPSIDMPRRRFNFRRIDQWWRMRTIFGPFGSEERAARDPFELVQTANPQETPYIYVTVGEQEPLLDPNRRFVARLKRRGFAYQFHTRHGWHDWAQWDEQLPIVSTVYSRTFL